MKNWCNSVVSLTWGGVSSRRAIFVIFQKKLSFLHHLNYISKVFQNILKTKLLKFERNLKE